jgi:2,4-dienoyl-CoA reductase-like NADH-dependent reductase (Old Yellow Enzyme family)
MKPFQTLLLPNGSTIPNRIAKAAMEENMADADHGPSAGLKRLYRAWADGGAGLILSGNVMIDRRAMTGPGGVVLENDEQMASFREWAAIGRAGGAQFWLQLNHPGRQMMKDLGQPTVAPSAVAIDLGRHSNLFGMPRAMTLEDIADVIARFATSARLAEQAGFSGVQIHAAHGYLISQFLSPLTNQRQDSWGGSLANRARLLIETVKAVRASVGPAFSVAVKLNSADFQRGGFDASDARKVVEMLGAYAVDLVELSGGSYEAPAMQGQTRDGRTLAREAYFLEFAQDIAAVASMPIMVTGGIRRLEVVEQVLAGGVAMAGIGTALAVNPALPNAWRSDASVVAELPPVGWKNKTMAALATMAVVKHQLRLLSEGARTSPGVSPLRAFVAGQLRSMLLSYKYRAWMTRRAAQ